MATRSQFHPEPESGCIHEKICQAMVERQRQQIQFVCDWMTPGAEQARALAASVLVEVCGAAGRDLAALADGQLLRCLAIRFRGLFATRNDDGEVAWSSGPLAVVPSNPLRGALLALPPAHRLLYLLHDVEGVPAASLGDWLDLAPIACARMIHLARQRLRANTQSAPR